MVTVRGRSTSRRVNSRTSASATPGLGACVSTTGAPWAEAQAGSQPGRLSHVGPIVRCPGDDHIADFVGAQCRDQPMLQGLGRQALEGNPVFLNPLRRLGSFAHRNQHPGDRQVLQDRREGCPGLLLFAKQDRHVKAGGQGAAEDHGLRIAGQCHDDLARLPPEPLRHFRAGRTRIAADLQHFRRSLLQHRAGLPAIGRGQHDRTRTWGERQQSLGLSRRRTADRHD